MLLPIVTAASLAYFLSTGQLHVSSGLASSLLCVAAAVIADPGFETVSPDYAFSLHNLPGLPLGHVGLAPGPVNCASRGMAVTLTGKSAHASEPENGTSPMAALSSLTVFQTVKMQLLCI